MGYVNIIGDTHNTKWLNIALKEYNNLISLGDIAAVDTKKFSKHQEWYTPAWKFLAGNEETCNNKALKWFKKINVKGWEKQLGQIKSSGRNFTLCLGNSDYRMLEFFEECRNSLKKLERRKSFVCYQNPKLLQKEKVQLFFLPFTFEGYSISAELEKLDSSKKLFVLGHCPAYKKHNKAWYEFYYKKLKQISKNYKGQIIYFHGHIHSDDSYQYKIKDFKNILFITPKAIDSAEGFGSFNHVINLNTQTGDTAIFDLQSGRRVRLKNLPKGYREKGDHWNNFSK